MSEANEWWIKIPLSTLANQLNGTFIHHSSGALTSIIPIFISTIASQEDSNPEYSEAIADVLAFTKEELMQGLLNGFLDVPLHARKSAFLYAIPS